MGSEPRLLAYDRHKFQGPGTGRDANSLGRQPQVSAPPRKPTYTLCKRAPK